MNQIAIDFNAAVPAARYDGQTIDDGIDHGRLSRQHALVFAAMRAGAWMTLRQVAQLTGAPEASVSARLRDFRKPKFGGHKVERRRAQAEAGTHEYRLIVADAKARVAAGLSHISRSETQV